MSLPPIDAAPGDHSTTSHNQQTAAKSSGFQRGIDGLLSIHRPIVVAHIRSIRKHHPNATPHELIRILEIRYLAAVTSGGAAVGAGSVLPGVGTGVSLALTSIETAGFLEASALFAQSVTEVHGIAVEDPDRARMLVMSMMLGTAGADLVRQLAGQFSGVGVSRNAYWGTMVTSNLPRFAVGPIADQLKTTFLKHLAARTGAGAVGRMLPFGVGAVIGGTGNHLLGRKVVNSARTAFGPPPMVLPMALEPTAKPVKQLQPKKSSAQRKAEREQQRALDAASGKSRGGLPKLPRRKKATTRDEAPAAPGSEWPDVHI